MSMKLTAAQVSSVNSVLTELDKLAHSIQIKHASWGMSFEAAKELVNNIDKIADTVEATCFGGQSLLTRQVEVFKLAKVIQQDADETYMSTFNSPTKPHQTDADEEYMKQFSDDQTTSVRSTLRG